MGLNRYLNLYIQTESKCSSQHLFLWLDWAFPASIASTHTPPCIFLTLLPLLLIGLFFHMFAEHSLHCVQINLLVLLTKLLYQLLDFVRALSCQNNVLCLFYLSLWNLPSFHCLYPLNVIVTQGLLFWILVEGGYLEFSESLFVIIKSIHNRKEK